MSQEWRISKLRSAFESSLYGLTNYVFSLNIFVSLKITSFWEKVMDYKWVILSKSGCFYYFEINIIFYRVFHWLSEYRKIVEIDVTDLNYRHFKLNPSGIVYTLMYLLCIHVIYIYNTVKKYLSDLVMKMNKAEPELVRLGDASIASPFTSKHPSIACSKSLCVSVCRLLRQLT